MWSIEAVKPGISSMPVYAHRPFCRSYTRWRICQLVLVPVRYFDIFSNQCLMQSEYGPDVTATLLHSGQRPLLRRSSERAVCCATILSRQSEQYTLLLLFFGIPHVIQRLRSILDCLWVMGDFGLAIDNSLLLSFEGIVHLQDRIVNKPRPVCPWQSHRRLGFA